MSDIKIPEALIKLGLTGDDLICFEPISAHAAAYEEFASVSDWDGYYTALSAYVRSVALSFCRLGVRFESLDGVLISPFAKIGTGTVIHPGVQIRSGVTIGERCVITSGSVIENSTIGDGCTVNSTQIYSSVLEDNVRIGPFCHVRPNSRLRNGVKVGDFVEIKNSDIGRDTHASHLTYIGDSDVGERVNFGCGVVTVNYDGSKKHRTVIGDDVFVGCNSNLVAPVRLENGAYTAAGSTITSDVPGNALGIARARQVNIDGWVTRKAEKAKKQ